MENKITKQDFIDQLFEIPGDYITDDNHPLAIWHGSHDEPTDEEKISLANSYIDELGNQFDLWCVNGYISLDKEDLFNSIKIYAQEKAWELTGSNAKMIDLKKSANTRLNRIMRYYSYHAQYKKPMSDYERMGYLNNMVTLIWDWKNKYEDDLSKI